LSCSVPRLELKHPPEKTPGGQATAVLKATTRLVQINVVVQDKKGEPVEGLKKEDFIVLDQGKEQLVATFSANSAVCARPLRTRPIRRTSSRTAAIRPRQIPAASRSSLLMRSNTPILDQFYARQQVLKFLRHLHPQDHVAIYVLTTKSFLAATSPASGNPHSGQKP